MEDLDSNMQYIEITQSNNEESELSNIKNDSFISTKSKVLNSVRRIKIKDNMIGRILTFLVYCNPLLRFIINLSNKNKCKSEEEKTQEDFNQLLSQKEKDVVINLVVIMLLIFNLVIIFSGMEYHHKVFVFFINNMYLLYFVFDIYRSENKASLDHSWDWVLGRIKS
jgi:hypothetical protein